MIVIKLLNLGDLETASWKNRGILNFFSYYTRFSCQNLSCSEFTEMLMKFISNFAPGKE